MAWLITQAEADAIVAEATPVEGRPSPADLWRWAQSYVSGGPESECGAGAAGRVALEFDLPSSAFVARKLDGWPGFRPRTLAYELHYARAFDYAEAAHWRAKRTTEVV